MYWLLPFLALGVSAILSYLGTRLLLPVLKRRAILDHPNDRSSHVAPTPRGGGIAVILVLVMAFLVIGYHHDLAHINIWIVSGAAILLAGISWIDDLRGLPPINRLLSQIFIVGLVLFLTSDGRMFFQGFLPPAPDIFLAGILWVWFINLFNFMDGIDGISGVETIGIGIGIGVVIGFQNSLGLYGLAAAGAAIGFLVWNWHPAQVFMGDVGSVPLGFLSGWLLLELAANGYWAPALILPAYYLADATITLVKRGLRGEKIWLAHREHCYQKAVQRGLSHATVSLSVLALNGALIGLALLASMGWPWMSLMVAVLLTLGFMKYLAGDEDA